jgi:hypothetical protein
MTIHHPGKYEGEQDYTPHFHQSAMDGVEQDWSFGGDSFVDWYGFVIVNSDDRKAFPQIESSTFAVMIHEDNQGFVTSHQYTREEYNRECRLMDIEESDFATTGDTP